MQLDRKDPKGYASYAYRIFADHISDLCDHLNAEGMSTSGLNDGWRAQGHQPSGQTPVPSSRRAVSRRPLNCVAVAQALPSMALMLTGPIDTSRPVLKLHDLPRTIPSVSAGPSPRFSSKGLLMYSPFRSPPDGRPLSVLKVVAA
jgi:hypothetical protein